ncbi:hypothetical protein ACSGVL_003342 [Salmonella enterica]
MNINTTFELYPNKGAGLIEFGMSPDDVEHILGKSDDSRVDRTKRLMEFRSFMNVSYTSPPTQMVNHIGFGRQMKNIIFDDVNVFSADPEIVIKKLMKYDNSPYLSLGMIFFMKLKISITGFHDGFLDQKAIAIFSHDDYEEYIPEMELYRCN